MIVHVKRDGDRIPVDCTSQAQYDKLVEIHGKDNVELPEGMVAPEPVEALVALAPKKKRGKK